MTKKQSVRLICIALILVFAGSFAAGMINGSGGDVKVRNINFVTEDGINLHALLYIPDSATDSAPAPAIVSSHGYNNTAEVQGINCVELSRRGYVVIAIDAYWHGLSGGTSINVDNGNVVGDMGGYAALQYIGSLPFVDSGRIGMVGHSMGCGVIQNAALRAFQNNESKSQITVPKALLLTSNAYNTDPEVKELAYAKYPVNVGVIYGQYDEWAENMWITVKKGSDINITPKAIAGMGFSGAEYETYYKAGIDTPLTREEAIDAAKDNSIRILYSPPIDHPQVHFSSAAARNVIEFFDVTLKAGTETLPQSNLVWYWKEIFTFIAMIGFLLFVVPFACLLLEAPYFKAIIMPEPKSPIVVSDSKSRLRYWLIFILCLLPAPFLFYWAVGYPIDIAAMGRTVPTVLPANGYFQLPAANGLVIINVICGAFLLIVFTITYRLSMVKSGAAFSDLGVKLKGGLILRALLLAVITFITTYMLLVLANYFFLSDFRLFVFSFKTLSAAKWPIFLKYLPFFAFFFIISSLTLNSFTRIRDRKEWVNILLIIIASCGGYVVLFLLDYGALITTGVKMFPFVPFQEGNLTSALCGLFVWNMIFILPLAAVAARLLFKKTGSIWLGGFINSLMVTLFAVSNTVISTGTLL